MLLGIARLTLPCIVLALLGIIALSVAAYKQRITAIDKTGLEGLNYFEDFFNKDQGTAYSVASSGTGGTGVISAGAPDDRTTFITTVINGASTGVAKFYMPSVIISDDTTATTLSTEMFLSGLSTGSDQVRMIWGAAANVDFDHALPTAGWQFIYDKTISNNWIIRAVTDASGLFFTQLITAVPVVANTYFRLKIVRGADFTYFFINGTQVGTITNTFASTSIYIGAQMSWVAGSPTITAAYDYNWLVQQFSTPRTAP